MNLVAIHLHFFKRQVFYFPQTKLHSPMPCGNKFQICLAQQHLPSTFWMEVPFSTKILWPSGEKFDAICSRYVQYVWDKYRSPVIVFDGYQNGPSTEDNTHSRRTKSSMASEVRFTGDIICSMKKDVFLSNKTNKQRFITLLSSHLQQSNIVVIHAEADADVLVAQTAIESAASTDTVLVGDDTDLLILLCRNSKRTNCELYFRREPKSNSQRAARCWNINQVQRVLGDQICDNLLFAHALLGCDTTSRVFGIGKAEGLRKLR